MGFLPCKRSFGPSDELETVLNSTFCYKLLQCARLCRFACRRTPDEEPPAVLWFIIGCRSTSGRLLPTGRKKGNHFFRKNQIYSHLFHQSLLNALELIVASFVAPARKVRIRLRPSTVMICRLSYSIIIQLP